MSIELLKKRTDTQLIISFHVESYRRFGCKSVLICLTIHENKRSYKAFASASRQSLA